MDGTELARVMLRTVVGTTMIAHGVKHGRSLEGTAGWFESIGFAQSRAQARASAVVEVGAGAAMIAGAGTPLAGSAVVATMAVAARTVHAANGFFITSEGYEYVLNLATASVVISALGSGRWSVDGLVWGKGRGSGVRRAALAAGLGLAAASVQLAVFWRRPLPGR
ncbi:DoxX family protein [Nocardia jiangxiensis]|uniref:DoxX family protein n=1 Tax=Nocardia jiangxiensis TaxID=282685 RepID=A0ABW6S1A7_9NOCA|nr:DoxX family protein [Nocardia jiangxiensis]